MNENKKSFWSSLPGILSGLAAIITAVATLYLALRSDNEESSENISQPDAIHESLDKLPERIQTVEVLQSGSEVRDRYGFFTPKGFVVTMKEGIENTSELIVLWYDGGTENRIRVKSIKYGINKLPVVLLKPIENRLKQHFLPIRSSVTLNVGEKVEKYLSHTDRSSGEVVALDS